jgi:hypothetical protein
VSRSKALEHALDRCESGGAGDEDDRAVAFLLEGERPGRSAEAQPVANLHLREHVGGEAPTGDQTHVQLDEFALPRRSRKRKTAGSPPSRTMLMYVPRGTAAEPIPAASVAAASHPAIAG